MANEDECIIYYNPKTKRIVRTDPPWLEKHIIRTKKAGVICISMLVYHDLTNDSPGTITIRKVDVDEHYNKGTNASIHPTP